MGKNSTAVKFVKQSSTVQVQEKTHEKLMPKRYLNPFIVFVQLNSAKLGEKGAPATSGMKMCGEAWSKMSDKDK
jgi:hypothetical protein